MTVLHFRSNLSLLSVKSEVRRCAVLEPDNEPAASAQKGISWPHQTIVETRDVVENVGRELFFRGRADNEIKLLGRRFNLDILKQLIIQIDNDLNNYAICNCEVLLREKRIMCVLQLSIQLTDVQFEELQKNMRKHLLKQVAEIFVPVEWILLPSIPYNQNGKLDKHFLMNMISLIGKHWNSIVRCHRPWVKSLHRTD